MTEIKVLSSLAKVFPTESLSKHYSPKAFSCFSNEKLRFQVALKPRSREILTLSVDCSDSFEVFEVGYEPVLVPVWPESDDNYLSKKPGLYPDILRPLRTDELHLVPGVNTVLYFEVSPRGAGEKTLKASFLDGQGTKVGTADVRYTVLPAELPLGSVICTHWFHTDCLCDEYGFEPFTPDYWRCVENYMRVAAEHSIDSLLVPLFTPALDTCVGAERKTVQLVKVKVEDGEYSFDFDDLRKWIDIAKRSGQEYFEFSHFFTQWGAKHCPKIVAEVNGEEKTIFGWETDSLSEEYVSFLRALASALKPVLKELMIEDRCLFHVSDEPGGDQLEHYKACSAVVNELFGEYKIIDALSDFDFYSKGAIKTPVPSVSHAEEFYGKVEELWTYYCCGPISGNYTNRFIAMPSARTRALGLQMYKYDVRGFLQWGYNYWYTQLSKYRVEPYSTADADKCFPAGDGFVVYPGKNFEPVCSLRLKVFDDAFKDCAALKLLEELAGRKKALEVLESGKKITFSSYPSGEKEFFLLREKINAAIAAALG